MRPGTEQQRVTLLQSCYIMAWYKQKRPEEGGVEKCHYDRDLPLAPEDLDPVLEQNFRKI